MSISWEEKINTDKQASMLSLFLQAGFTRHVDIWAFKQSHWCTCRMQDTRRQRCCCCSPTAASAQDSWSTGLCSGRGWLHRAGGQSSHQQARKVNVLHTFIDRLIVNTYCTAGCCRLWGSLYKWFLTCMGGCTGSSLCDVVQDVIVDCKEIFFRDLFLLFQKFCLHQRHKTSGNNFIVYQLVRKYKETSAVLCRVWIN